MHCEKFNIEISKEYCTRMRTVIIDGSNKLRSGYPMCMRVPEWVLSRIQKCGNCEHIGHIPDIITLEEWKKIALPVFEMAFETIFRPTQEYDHERRKAYWREYQRYHKRGGEK